MISVARKNLWAEKFRLVISVGGVLFSTFLIMVLLGIYYGLTVQITRYINKTPADIWVMEEGTRDMFHSFSLLPDNLKNQIERKIGSGRVYRLIARPTQLKVRTKDIYVTKRQREKFGKEEEVPKATINLIGYDTATGVGGPWKIKEGKKNPEKNEVVIDAMLARNKNVGLGDKVEILNENFTVVGISEETNLITEQMVFANFDQAQDLLNLKGKVNYYLVQLDNPKERFEVKTKIIQEVSKVSAKTKAEFASANAEMVNESFVPIIFTIVIIGFLVGSVVVGLTIYTTTMEKIREFGILKAIGARNSILFQIVLEQSFWIIILGFVGGTLLTLFSIPIIAKSAALEISLTPLVFLESLISTILMGLLASYIPIKKIASVDPVMVFKS